MSDALRRLCFEVALAVLVGAATLGGVKLAQRLDDPYSEPRLTIGVWLDRLGGGDPT